MNNEQMNQAKNKTEKSEIKTIEKRLSERFRNFRDIMIYAIDNEQKLILYNKMFRDTILDKYKIEVRVGLPFNEIILDVDDYITLQKSHKVSLAGKSITNIQIFNFEISSYYECFYGPLFDSENNVIASISFIRNLTEESQDEKARKISEDQIKKIASVLKLGLTIQEIIYDQRGEPIDTQFIYINKKYERITGLKLEEIKGKRLPEVIPDASDSSDWLDKYKPAIVSGETVVFELFAPYIKKWFNITAYSPLQNRLVLLLTDVSFQKESEEKLKQSEAFYRSTVENLMAGVIVCNKEGKVLSANPEALRSKVKLIEDGYIPLYKSNNIFYNEEKEEIEINDSPMTLAFTYKKPIINKVIGTKCTHEDEFAWINISIIPILNDDDQIDRLIINFLDLTLRKKMEERILNDKNVLSSQKSQVDATLMAIAEGVFSTDVHGIIQSYNNVASELTEYPPQEVLGKHFDDIFVFVDDTYQKNYENIITVEDLIHFKDTRIKRTLISKSKKEYQVEISASPILNANEKIIGSVIIMRNITEELQMTRRLIIERQRLERVIEASTDMLIEIDMDYCITSLSGKGLEIININPSEYIGRKLSEIFTDANDNRDYAYHSAFQGKQYTYDWEYAKDEHTLWFECTVSPIFDENNQVIGALNVTKETTERKQKQVEIEYLSTHDGLTKIHNRHFFIQKLKILDFSYYYPLGIIMADMDSLKLINDIFGHQVGDEALQKIADVLKQSFRQEDIVTRIGGDEFAIILPNTTNERLEQRKKLIQDRINAVDVRSIPLSVSIGFKMKTSGDQDIDYIMKEAENNMYADKRLNSAVYHNRLISAFQTNLYNLYPEEKVHKEKVFKMGQSLIKTLDLTSDMVRDLSLATQIHDLGKLFIPVNIYRKSEPLTLLEYRVIQQHVAFTHKLLILTTDYSAIADIVHHHHENWDGSGYPFGLKGEAIPYLSRVLAIIDSFSAMTSPRPYRKAMSKQEAIEELKKAKGKKFDPQILDLVIKSII